MHFAAQYKFLVIIIIIINFINRQYFCEKYLKTMTIQFLLAVSLACYQTGTLKCYFFVVNIRLDVQ